MIKILMLMFAMLGHFQHNALDALHTVQNLTIAFCHVLYTCDTLDPGDDEEDFYE